MSTLSDWSYTNTATVWPVTTDEFGQPAYGTPYTLAATWADTGETQTDDNGSEFTPASTFWFEAEYTDVNLPQRGDYIAKFDQTSVMDPVVELGNDAQQIKKVTSYDMSMFGASEIPDWEAFT